MSSLTQIHICLTSRSFLQPTDFEEIKCQMKEKKDLKNCRCHLDFPLFIPISLKPDTFSVSSMSHKSRLSNPVWLVGGTVRRQHTIVTSIGSSFKIVTTSWWFSPSKVMPFTCAKREVAQERTFHEYSFERNLVLNKYEF